jgi:GNAT superfamily N-acetyltransferase
VNAHPQMTGITVAPAASDQDVQGAFELAKSVFAGAGAADDGAYKSLLWFEDPTFEPRNLLLAKSASGVPCGLVRIVPRVMVRVGERYTVAGISSVCLAPEVRGGGHSRTLMEHALQHCRDRDFDFAFLVARRAADHYYTRFGFRGIASYSRVMVRVPGAAVSGALALGEPDAADVPVYSAAYDACYANTFWRVERTAAYWRFLMERCRRQGLRLSSLVLEGRSVGYAITGAAVVHELAYTDEVPAGALVRLLADAVGADATLLLEMPPEHRFVVNAYGLDMTLSARECTYGGHMVRVLSTLRLLERLAARAPADAAALAHLAHTDCLDHRETCRLLGAWSPTETRAGEDRPLHFDVSLADQV